MYYPYFRGKQNELITIRNNAELLSRANFVPIIEPVKESLSGLNKALSAVIETGGQAVIIVNPYYGDHSGNADEIISLIQNEFNSPSIMPGILLLENEDITEIKNIRTSLSNKPIAFIHAGFNDAKYLVNTFKDINEMRHIFIEDCTGKLYQKYFKDSLNILIRDGFHKRKNREYPPVEFFSDLHVTYDLEGMKGFGDFLIVGDDYSETGGPAYAVAIHLTFIDPNKDDAMFIHHFISDRQDDPTDPAGKFFEALEKMITEINNPKTHILKTSSVDEFIDLHSRGHFPGLGYVKKLSMIHHIETLAQYFDNN